MGRFEALLLGTAQDAGIPQAGCGCPRCRAAQENPALRRFPASLALIDHGERRFWLLDATPALPEQLYVVESHHPGLRLAGVLLTHAHSGHYTGLLHFGREAWATRDLPLWASERMRGFLELNQPWRTIAGENMAAQTLVSGRPLALTAGLVVHPLSVPHRGEFSDTLAFIVETAAARLFYCPDIDSWEHFPLRETLDQVDFALLDGTFFSADELPGRDMRLVPHPIAVETARLAAGCRAQVWFIHLNHTNPLNEETSERRSLAEQGFGVASQGQAWEL